MYVSHRRFVAVALFALSVTMGPGSAKADDGRMSQRLERRVERSLAHAQLDPDSCQVLSSEQLRHLGRLVETAQHEELSAVVALLEEVQGQALRSSGRLVRPFLLSGQAPRRFRPPPRSVVASAQCRLDELEKAPGSAARTQALQRLVVAAAAAGAALRLDRSTYQELHQAVCPDEGEVSLLSLSAGLAMLQMQRPGSSTATAVELLRRVLVAADRRGAGYFEVMAAIEGALEGGVAGVQVALPHDRALRAAATLERRPAVHRAGRARVGPAR